jgi:hypothetical protein
MEGFECDIREEFANERNCDAPLDPNSITLKMGFQRKTTSGLVLCAASPSEIIGNVIDTFLVLNT